MTVIKNSIKLLLVVLMSLMAINLLQAKPVKEPVLGIEPAPEILPAPIPQMTRVAQLGCKYDRKLNTLMYLFFGSGINHLATDEEKEVQESVENDFAPKSCARVLTRLVNAGYYEKSATSVGGILIYTLYRHRLIKPIPLPSVQ